MPVTFDTTALPLVMQRFDGPVDRADLDANNATLLKLMRDGQRIVTVAVVGELGHVDRKPDTVEGAVAWARTRIRNAAPRPGPGRGPAS